jgi:CelD/BcsL family acetyltransferase involved in cellulose biosynthesis
LDNHVKRTLSRNIMAHATATTPSELDVSIRDVEDQQAWNQWDHFASEHPRGTIFHLSAWTQVLYETFAHIRARLLLVQDRSTHELVAGLPIFRVNSHLLGRRLISAPFAFCCDPLASDEAFVSLLLNEAIALGRQERASAIELRTLYPLPVTEIHGFAAMSQYRHHTLRLDSPTERLKRGFSRTCVRQWLSKAMNNEVRVRHDKRGSSLAALYKCLTDGRRRKSLPPMPLRFFQAIQTTCDSAQASIFIAEQGTTVFAAALALKHGDTFILEYAGEADEGRKTGAAQLLYWEAIQQAQREGYQRFSFGRTSVTEKGLMDYKRRWGAAEEDIYTYIFPSSQAKQNRNRDNGMAARMVRIAAKHAPKPLYRLLGEFCYRHLG